jgi:hypothetical protein
MQEIGRHELVRYDVVVVGRGLEGLSKAPPEN